MAQHDYSIANQSGAAFRSDLNNALSAIVTQNSGATAPSTTYAYQSWADTTTGVMKMRNGANSAWITLYQLDGEWSTIAFENGTAAAPSIYFKDSGTDTGLFSPGTDAVAISTGGSERLRVDSSGRLGVGTQSPGALVDLGTATPILRFSDTDTAGYHQIQSSNANFIINADPSNADASSSISFNVDGSERVRVDSSGRLLVGTSTARANFNNAALSPLVQIEGTTAALSSLSVTRNSADGSAPYFSFGKSRSASIGGNTVVVSGDTIGELRYEANDGTEFVLAARISAEVDGTPGADDMPGRILFSTTADGASTPTEQLRITSDGVQGYNQAAPVAVNATATLTIANLKNGIITSTTAAAVTGTLPTGTLTEGGFSGLYTNFTFQWTVINTGATNSFTVQAGTDHTVVGNMVVAAGNSGRFATRRTAANTFVTYRLSS